MTRRLLPNAEEQKIVNVLLAVRHGSPTTVEQLITLATQLEQDEATESSGYRKPANNVGEGLFQPPALQPAGAARPMQAPQQQRAPARSLECNAERLPKCPLAPVITSTGTVPLTLIFQVLRRAGGSTGQATPGARPQDRPQQQQTGQ